MLLLILSLSKLINSKGGNSEGVVAMPVNFGV